MAFDIDKNIANPYSLTDFNKFREVEFYKGWYLLDALDL
jgi:hypothetical protein